MATKVEINGVSFLSIKEAARVASYSRDYLSKLAREEKIKAVQVGRQWFIEMISLQSFIDNKILEQEVYRRRLSEERKREREVKEKLENISAVFKKTKPEINHSFSTALLVLSSGLALGVVIFLASSILNVDNYLRPFQGEKYSATISSSAVSLEKSNYTKDNLPDEKKTAVGHVVSSYPLFSDEAEVRKITEKDMRGIFLLAREGNVENEKSIANLFSDEVEVKFLDENTGVINFKDVGGNVSEFPFISVPRTQTTNDVSATDFINKENSATAKNLGNLEASEKTTSRDDEAGVTSGAKASGAEVYTEETNKKINYSSSKDNVTNKEL